MISGGATSLYDNQSSLILISVVLWCWQPEKKDKSRDLTAPTLAVKIRKDSHLATGSERLERPLRTYPWKATGFEERENENNCCTCAQSSDGGIEEEKAAEGLGVRVTDVVNVRWYLRECINLFIIIFRCYTLPVRDCE